MKEGAKNTTLSFYLRRSRQIYGTMASLASKLWQKHPWKDIRDNSTHHNAFVAAAHWRVCIRRERVPSIDALSCPIAPNLSLCPLPWLFIPIPTQLSIRVLPLEKPSVFFSIVDFLLWKPLTTFCNLLLRPVASRKVNNCGAYVIWTKLKPKLTHTYIIGL